MIVPKQTELNVSALFCVFTRFGLFQMLFNYTELYRSRSLLLLGITMAALQFLATY